MPSRPAPTQVWHDGEATPHTVEGPLVDDLGLAVPEDYDRYRREMAEVAGCEHSSRSRAMRRPGSG